jgi:hypothetical protein
LRVLLRPVPVAACAAIALLATVVGYQNVATVPRLRSQLAAAQAPQAASWHFLSVSRGEPSVIEVSPSHPMVGLTLARPAGPPPRSYRCEVRHAGGQVVWSFAVPTPSRGDEIEIVIPASRLRPGAYVIGLGALESTSNGPESDLAQYPFTLRLGED